MSQVTYLQQATRYLDEVNPDSLEENGLVAFAMAHTLIDIAQTLRSIQHILDVNL